MIFGSIRCCKWFLPLVQAVPGVLETQCDLADPEKMDMHYRSYVRFFILFS